ncbi:MAG: helix-turn-helix transcriptional regulator [Erysipelothrix sp.]|nr:helix-turn-helix transcriptional regulator [Erysipelothrix sp.]
MILADKIVYLRKKSGLSQEELASELNVSRQSISKWEGAQSIPELDKIISLAHIFNVSTDFLLKDDIEELDGEMINSQKSTSITLEYANEMIEANRRASKHIGCGVMGIIMSVSGIVFAEAYMYKHPVGYEFLEPLSVAFLLLVVAGAVGLFIKAGMNLDQYPQKGRDLFELSYGVRSVLEKQKQTSQSSTVGKLIIGIMMCILGVIPLLFTSESSELIQLYAVVALLIIVAMGVNFIIQAGMHMDVYEQLLKPVHEVIKENQNEKMMGLIAAIYWPLMVVIYLGYSFTTSNWEYSWIIWPLAGVFFAVIAGIVNLFSERL